MSKNAEKSPCAQNERRGEKVLVTWAKFLEADPRRLRPDSYHFYILEYGPDRSAEYNGDDAVDLRYERVEPGCIGQHAMPAEPSPLADGLTATPRDA